MDGEYVLLLSSTIYVEYVLILSSTKIHVHHCISRFFFQRFFSKKERDHMEPIIVCYPVPAEQYAHMSPATPPALYAVALAYEGTNTEQTASTFGILNTFFGVV